MCVHVLVGRPAKAENVIIQKFGKTLEIIQFEVS